MSSGGKEKTVLKSLYITLFLIAITGISPVRLDARPGAVRVTVDPRMELLGVVQILVKDYPIRSRYDFAYKREVLTDFSQYRDHRAVKMFEQLWVGGCGFDCPPTLMLYLSAPPRLRVKIPLPEELVRRAGGIEKVNEFYESLRQFALDTKFLDFFAENKRLYQQIISNERQKLEAISVGVVEDYYGARQHSYNIILSPLMHHGGFGPRVARRNGTYDIYSIDGAAGAQNDSPFFGSREEFRYLIWHEFSHSFVNPIVDKYEEETDKYSPLLRPIEAQMKKAAYPKWDVVVKEHLVRAVSVRLTYRELGEQAGATALEDEKGRGFAYVGDICERLKQYEADRKRYPTFASFYPEIIKLFEELSKRVH